MSAARTRQPREATAGSVVPMTPRPRVLAVLSIVFALWVGVLITLYFTTVRPLRTAEPKPPAVLPR